MESPLLDSASMWRWGFPRLDQSLKSDCGDVGVSNLFTFLRTNIVNSRNLEYSQEAESIGMIRRWD